MKAICIREPLNQFNEKVMEFTLGKEYEFFLDDEGDYNTLDDYGNHETFFDITKLFKIIE